MQSTNRAVPIALLALLAPVPTVHAQTLSDLHPALATVAASDGATNDLFGHSVSLSGDTLAVGVPGDQVGATVGQGSVRVYVRSGSSWVLQQTLTASDGGSNDGFGWSVSLSGDTLAVGVWNDAVGANAGQGSVRVFTRSGSTWTAQQTLTASDGAAGDNFGWSVSLSGELLAVGVASDNVGSNGSQGSVRVFGRSGTTWTTQATLTASDGASFDNFGWSVSLSGDMLAVGVPNDSVGSNAFQGTVRMYSRAIGSWLAQGTLSASDGAASDSFGQSVSLVGDTLAIGAPGDDIGSNNAQGSVRVFTRSGLSWVAQATLTAADGAANDELGSSVSLSGDIIAAGAQSDDVGLNQNQGSIRMFGRAAGTWSAIATVASADGVGGDALGCAVSLSGDTVAAGARTDDVGSTIDQGTARIFGNYRVWNDTFNAGYPSLASAINSSSAGNRLLVGNLAFAQATGVIDASQKRFNFVALEPLTINASTLLSLATNSVFEKSPDVASGGLTVAGDLSAPAAGSLAFEQLTVSSGGQFLQRGSTILVNQNLATTSGGVCYLQGPVLAEAVTTAAGAQNRVAGDTDVFANYTNAGSTVIQRGILYIYGTLTNTGTITGQFNNGFLPPNPGDGYSIGGDYIVSAESSIILPDPVWWLRVGGNFDVAINASSRFVMDLATLELTGVGPATLQSVEVLSRDFGAVESGFATTNYLLGTLRLRAGSNAELVDNHNNAPGKGAEAIYTKELVVPAGATLVTNGLKIYTRAATIAGTVSNPGDVVVVPGAPPCIADVVPDGVVNSADLGVILAGWGPCTGSTCFGDLNRDGQVDSSDLGIVLSAWGPCAN
jgi:hypothetical protein